MKLFPDFYSAGYVPICRENGGGGNRTRVIFRWLAVSACLGGLGVVGLTGAAAQVDTLGEFSKARAEARERGNEARRHGCRGPLPRFTHPAYLIPAEKWPRVLAMWRQRARRAEVASSRCGPRAVIARVFGPTAWAALAVARCESGLNPRAVGAAGERGLFQIHPIHRSWLGATWGHLFDARTNARVAYRMSDHGTDWGAWTCQP